METHVIETVTFKLNEGVSPEDFTERAKAINAFIESCDGFVARRLSRASDGTWIDHVEWRTMETALAAAARIGKDLHAGPFMAAIDGESVVMTHSMLEISVA
ncbi:MAG: hypothetical protein AAGE89_10905 [Pseudomonadota bacterium]